MTVFQVLSLLETCYER